MAPRVQLDSEAVAERVGMKVESFRRQRVQPHWAPEPDGYIGRSPWWWSSTIDRWNKKRPRAGRPRVDA